MTINNNLNSNGIQNDIENSLLANLHLISCVSHPNTSTTFVQPIETEIAD
jgi:hypothetical protein